MTGDESVLDWYGRNFGPTHTQSCKFIDWRMISVAEDMTKQKFIMVKTKVEVTWQAIQKAAKRGFSAWELRGELLCIALLTERGSDRPIFVRLKRFDFPLAVHDQFDCDRLHAAGG